MKLEVRVPSGVHSRQGKGSSRRQECNWTQPYFIVTNPRPGLVDCLTQIILFELYLSPSQFGGGGGGTKHFLITTQPQVYSNLRHIYTEILYKVHLASFTRMGTADSWTVSNI